ncbi:hypothetical protein QA633_39675 [Bradyrhizobium barranii]|uniref:hypothetical protein n=1 Tax=Bradyrhizobium barranii TaxID=2992140 RepID=UPI0024AF4C04|nr:hypothetical protein [Bradyrhizobium barranii]WFT94329.1 hypothetical protein QA633_39675 [Bradyrhizobium barranii]
MALIPGDGREDEADADTFKPMREIVPSVVDRFAAAFRDDRSQDDLFGWSFWERLYGPDCGVYYGLIDWTDDYIWR